MSAPDTWGGLFGVGEELTRLDHEQARAVADDTRRIADDTRAVQQRFDTLLTTDGAQCGEAAEALVALYDETNLRLSDVAPVFDDVSVIFRDHAATLEALQRDVRRALALARTAWTAKETAEGWVAPAEAEIARSSGLVADGQRTLAQLEAARDDAPDDATYSAVTTRLANWREVMRDRHVALRNAERHLGEVQATVAENTANFERFHDDASFPESYVSLREREDALVRETATRLRDVDLRGLGNPGLLEQVVNVVTKVIDVVVFPLDDIIEFISEHGELFHAIRDALANITQVLGVLALVTSLIPGLQWAAAIFTIALAIVAVTQFLLSATLFFTDTADADGNTLSATDLLVDTASAALAVVGVGGALSTLRSAPAFATTAVTRQGVGAAGRSALSRGRTVLSSTDELAAAGRTAHLRFTDTFADTFANVDTVADTLGTIGNIETAGSTVSNMFGGGNISVHEGIIRGVSPQSDLSDMGWGTPTTGVVAPSPIRHCDVSPTSVIDVQSDAVRSVPASSSGVVMARLARAA